MRVGSSLEFDYFGCFGIQMCLLAILLQIINALERLLELSDIDTSEILFLFDPFTKLTQKIFMVVALLYLEFESFLFFSKTLDLLLSLGFGFL